jgi:hypothetical protein
MKTKIKTPLGYLCLPDERMVENAATAYNKISKHRDIDILQITSDDAKKAYRISNPYGVGYTDHYDRVLASKKAIQKLNAGKPTRKINFIEIS